MPKTDFEIIDTLRGLMARQKLKMTDLARDINIPYRSLQNYMAKKSPMPLAVYIEVCDWIGITPDYPVKERFKLNHHTLQDALIWSFGEDLFNSIEFDEQMRWTIGPKREMDLARMRGRAGYFAGAVASKYDMLSEARLRKPEEDEEEVGQ